MLFKKYDRKCKDLQALVLKVKEPKNGIKIKIKHKLMIAKYTISLRIDNEETEAVGSFSSGYKQQKNKQSRNICHRLVLGRA